MIQEKLTRGIRMPLAKAHVLASPRQRLSRMMVWARGIGCAVKRLLQVATSMLTTRVWVRHVARRRRKSVHLPPPQAFLQAMFDNDDGRGGEGDAAAAAAAAAEAAAEARWWGRRR